VTFGVLSAPDCIYAPIQHKRACVRYRAAWRRLWMLGLRAAERVIGRRKAIDRAFLRVVGWAVHSGEGWTGSRRKPERCLEGGEVFARPGRTLHAVRNRGYRLANRVSSGGGADPGEAFAGVRRACAVLEVAGGGVTTPCCSPAESSERVE